MRSADEIHAHLLEELNFAFRRPGVYGDELHLRLLISHLLYVEDNGTMAAWQDELQAGGAFYSTGVKGAVELFFPEADLGIIYSVYAEFARQRHWLTLDRELTTDEYESMAGQIADWCTEDTNWQDVLTAFGQPSVLFGGTNPRFGKTLGYATAQASDPMIAFQLWNGSDPERPETCPAYDDPVLLAVRRGNTPFADCLTFTPEGTKRRPPLPDWFLDD
jgi:hypothetical protein